MDSKNQHNHNHADMSHSSHKGHEKHSDHTDNSDAVIDHSMHLKNGTNSPQQKNVDKNDMHTMHQGSTHNMDHMNHHGHGDSNYSFADVSIVAISFFLVIGLFYSRRIKQTEETKPGWRFDILKLPFLEAIVRNKFFPFLWRFLPTSLFLLVLASGFWGRSHHGFAAGVTWLFWWTILIFMVAFAGKIFCSMCPWDFFADLFQYGIFGKGRGKGQSLGKRWPKLLGNIYLATFLFIVLTWLELGFDLTKNSYMTAVLGLSVLMMAVLAALVFKKRAFCRYACPVGRISGLYSLLSPFEIRARDHDVCSTCTTKECVKGNQKASACPTSLVPYKLTQNTYCTLCTECVRSCDKKNMTIKMRPFGTDLFRVRDDRKDEAILALIMLVLTLFHGLTMTQTWFDWTGSIGAEFRLTYLQSFTILMTALLVVSFIVVLLFEKLVEWSSDTKGLAVTMAFVFIPITLGYHLGHNSMHLFGEIGYLVPLLNDPFGYGWDILSQKDYTPTPLLSHEFLKWIQFACIFIGFYFSAKILKIRVNLRAAEVQSPTLVFASHFVFLLALGMISLWLAYQPMVMRSGG